MTDSTKTTCEGQAQCTVEPPEVSTYGRSVNGSCVASFHPREGIEVQVRPMFEEQNQVALALARDLSLASAAITALTKQRDYAIWERDEAKKVGESWKARVKEQERKPARLLGTGYVRFNGAEIWVLGGRERGFGHFGYCVDSWDDLFRRFDVRVTGHGADEHGPWWSVENTERTS